MVTLATVEQQLKAIGCNFRFWGRPEMRELCEILLPGETIAGAVNGQYDAGFAMLVATDFRILLIDKKPKYLTLKDIRFDMITELDFSGRMMNSTVRIYTPNKELRFTTPSGKRLRKLYTYSQHKVMEIRHRFMMNQFQQQHDVKNTPPGIAMAEQYQQQLPAGASGFAEPLPATVEANADTAPRQEPTPAYEPPAAGFYNPEPAQHTDEQKRLAIAMGAMGLRKIVHEGRVISEYMTIPFSQRWRKRPYGYTRDSLQHQQPSS